jgi:hypothetical protein
VAGLVGAVAVITTGLPDCSPRANVESMQFLFVYSILDRLRTYEDCVFAGIDYRRSGDAWFGCEDSRITLWLSLFGARHSGTTGPEKTGVPERGSATAICIESIHAVVLGSDVDHVKYSSRDAHARHVAGG